MSVEIPYPVVFELVVARASGAGGVKKEVAIVGEMKHDPRFKCMDGKRKTSIWGECLQEARLRRGRSL
jgi:hypothetical protein